MNLWILCGIRAILAKFGGDFYGMKRARVGAFTDFGGLRYRNPVHFLGTFPIFHPNLGFSGLVYYSGHFRGSGLDSGLNFKNMATRRRVKLV